ncbi:MAG: glycosyltransferase family 2 protein [Candidatus Kapabacteria bacterium]|nr:glycosyltransferase family 2 protein [Candidatus Kapabacteria bacterium]
MPSSRPHISAVLICHNEVSSIPGCIQALRGCCDEIVVVDSGSTDGTLELLREMGIRTVHRDFDGYGKQKRYACSLARNQWILSIDADEILSEQLSKELQSFKDDGQSVAYRLPRRFRFLGKTFLHGHGSLDHPIRLFRKDVCEFDEALVHESVIVNGAVGKMRYEIVHESYINLGQYLTKFDRYTTLGAERLIFENRNRSVVLSGISIPIYFIKQYLIWGHYRNGVHGFVWSILSSLHPFVKVAKAWAMRKP